MVSNFQIHPLTSLSTHRIHDALLHALHASPTNWPTLIQNHALSLLRNGECTTFHEVLERVLEDIHADTVVARSISTSAASTKSTSNGHSFSNKNNESIDSKNITKLNADVNGQKENKQSLALPPNVVEEGLRITREFLESICDVDDQSWE